MRSLSSIFILFFLISNAFGYSPSFLEYIKQSENGIKEGWNGKLWFPHTSFEGGSPTIAYGHKILNSENFKGGITEKQALELLIKDLDKAARIAKKIISKHNVEFDKLPEWKREVFIDFQFNGVLKSFPKFIKAVLGNDIKGMIANYKRKCKGSELKDRNSRFYNRYLKRLVKVPKRK